MSNLRVWAFFLAAVLGYVLVTDYLYKRDRQIDLVIPQGTQSEQK